MTPTDNEALVKRLRKNISLRIATWANEVGTTGTPFTIFSAQCSDTSEAATALESLTARPTRSCFSDKGAETHSVAVAIMRRINTETRIGTSKTIDPDHAVEIIEEYLIDQMKFQPTPSQWQTMESAPRDGTDILVYCGPVDDPIWAIAHWDDAEPDTERRKVYHMEDRIAAGWVLWWTGDMKRHGWPTHWQPLPAPPTEQDKP